jgi:hypothetical protein
VVLGRSWLLGARTVLLLNPIKFTLLPNMKFLQSLKVTCVAMLGAASVLGQGVPTYHVENIADLANIRINPGGAALAVLKGRVLTGDGGGGLWFYQGNSTAATNTSTVVAAQSGTGRWLKADMAMLGPSQSYQALPVTPADEGTYTFNLQRGTALGKTNVFGIGADNTTVYLQSWASYNLHLNSLGNGLRVGPNGTAIQAILSSTNVLDFPSIPANSATNLTVTVTGAGVGDSVSLGTPATLIGGLTVMGYVSAPDTVTVRAANSTTGPIDPASGTYRATVIKF